MRSMACSSGQTPQRERRENCCVICMESKTLSRIRKKSDSLRGQHETVLLCWFCQGLLWVLVYICIICIYSRCSTIQHNIQCTYFTIFTVISYMLISCKRCRWLQCVTLSSQWRWRVSRTALLSVTRGWQSDQPWQVWAVSHTSTTPCRWRRGNRALNLPCQSQSACFSNTCNFNNVGGERCSADMFFFRCGHHLLLIIHYVIYHWNDTIHLWE